MFMPSLNLSLQKNSHAIYDVLKEDRREMKYFDKRSFIHLSLNRQAKLL